MHWFLSRILSVPGWLYYWLKLHSSVSQTECFPKDTHIFVPGLLVLTKKMFPHYCLCTWCSCVAHMPQITCGDDKITLCTLLSFHFYGGSKDWTWDTRHAQQAPLPSLAPVGSKSATVGAETRWCILPSRVPLNHFAIMVQKQLTEGSKWRAVNIKSSDSCLMLTLRIKHFQLPILFGL